MNTSSGEHSIKKSIAEFKPVDALKEHNVVNPQLDKDKGIKTTHKTRSGYRIKEPDSTSQPR